MTATAPEYGAFSFIDSPALVETLGRSGLEWVCLDAQHGRWDDRSILAALDLLGPSATGRDGAARVLVRPRAADFGLIGRALDAGAAGVIVPMVDGVEDARRVIGASYYPPLGHRSFGPIRSPFGAADDVAAANGGIVVALMIETPGALAEVDEIAALDGVDMLFVGPFDLSASLGTTVDALLDDDSEGNPLSRVAAASRAAGIRFGAFAGRPDRAPRFVDHGADFVSVSSDLDLLGLGAATALGSL
ncbi:HpcH/HpaI aldolase family protein [Labedella phragmitis]|uniref:HpcH/HpaI aldolase family protein n=1 Tax=Labedella phragmitis TaxID=2498849 RepID=UPI00140D27BB|nr:aldolase/citrate lyase family protein [Labedella phragmitis]